MTKILLVGAGGFIGSVLRYAIGGLVHRFFPAGFFPVGTLSVNVLGCLALGALAGMAEARSIIGAHTRVFLMIGVLGGFTTFSTFGYETFSLAREAAGLKALSNVALNVILGLAAVWVGYSLTRT